MHPGDRLRETFGYSAFWAGVLPAVALALAVAQTALVAFGLPQRETVRTALGDAVGVYPGTVPTYLALVVAPAVAVALGIIVVALARGPGQRSRRGWRPERYEFLFVVLWFVPVVGPGTYLLGAGRRFVSMRFLREKLAAAGLVATDDLDDAEEALQNREDATAANAFDAAGRLVQELRDDAHFRNPTIGSHLEGLARGCGMATAICEHRTTGPTDDEPTPDDGTTSTTGSTTTAS
jgi:hypothetical protein